MDTTAKVLVGVAGAAATALVWELAPQKNEYQIAKLEGNPLAVMEHYHWGLISMIAARYTKKYQPYLDGFGVGLIVAEAAQPEPFAINKPYFGASTAIGLLLTGVLVLSFGWKPKRKKTRDKSSVDLNLKVECGVS